MSILYFLSRLIVPTLLLASSRSEGDCVLTSSKRQCGAIQDQGAQQGHLEDEALFIQLSVKNEQVSSHAAPSNVAKSHGAKTEQHLLSQHLLLQKVWASQIWWSEHLLVPLALQLEPWSRALHLSKADPGLDEWDTQDTVMVACMVFALGIFDLLVVPRIAHNSRQHVITLVLMLLASSIFGIIVWKQRGAEDGLAWLTGFVVEWALSMDNLFVFHLVFKGFSVPKDQSISALRIGIYGAICFRMVFILCLSKLITLHYAVDIVVGGLLIISGIFSLSDSDDEDVHNLATVRFFKWLLGSRLQDNYHEEGRLFSRNAGGELRMTVLFLVVCVISVVDCVFAVDSVGSKIGQIKSRYINVTSCLMAMFSLRSLFFIVRDLADYFDYVKYGICAILCFVGSEMMCQHWINLPLGYMCLVITLLFAASLVASVAMVPKKTAEDQLKTHIASVLQPQKTCREADLSAGSADLDPSRSC